MAETERPKFSSQAEFKSKNADGTSNFVIGATGSHGEKKVKSTDTKDGGHVIAPITGTGLEEWSAKSVVPEVVAGKADGRAAAAVLGADHKLEAVVGGTRASRWDVSFKKGQLSSEVLTVDKIQYASDGVVEKLDKPLELKLKDGRMDPESAEVLREAVKQKVIEHERSKHVPRAPEGPALVDVQAAAKEAVFTMLNQQDRLSASAPPPAPGATRTV